MPKAVPTSPSPQDSPNVTLQLHGALGPSYLPLLIQSAPESLFHAGTWGQLPLPLLLDKGSPFPRAHADVLESPTGLEEQAPMCLRKVGGQESGGGGGGQ